MSEDTKKFFYEICQVDIEAEKKAAAEAAVTQSTIESAQKMIAGKKLTYEEIAECTDLPLQKVLELAGECV